VKYQVTLTLELEIDAPTREDAETLMHNVRQAAEWAEPRVRVQGNHAEWEEEE
jgi:hypothetical protein